MSLKFNSIKKFLKQILKKARIEIFKQNISNSSLFQLKAVLDLLSIDVVLDIGANEGQFAKDICGMGFSGKIVSFEPLSSARVKLLKLSEMHKNWYVHEQVAIGGFNGKIEINISGNSVSSSILPMLDSHKSAAIESEYIGSEFVSKARLDDVFKNYVNLGSNSFIKIDTQSYEWEVIMGATETLKSAKGVICELTLVPLYSGQKLWREIIDTLEKMDFKLWAIQKGFTNPITGQTLQMDAIFIKKDIMANLAK
jgi:FkbM family methyltransferase